MGNEEVSVKKKEKEHYENTPTQIYWKFYHQKWKFSDKNMIFYISAENIDCVSSLDSPRRGGCNEYPQAMVLSRYMKIM